MTTRNRQLVLYINGEPYYSAQKAQEELNMTYSGLRNQVIAGNIKSEIPKGRRQAYYRGKDVDQLAREFKIYTYQRKDKKAEFMRATTEEEVMQCLEISKQLFGSERGDLKKHMRVIEKNPETYYMLSEEGQAIGYTAIWPVKPSKIDDLLSQTIPVKISPEDIETFESGKTISLYINVIGIKPGFTKEDKKIYASRLIAGLVGVIINLGARGINIETIAARSNMPDGIRLMKSIGFTEIEPATPERRTFIINISESGIPFVMHYKQALRESQAQQNSHARA